MAKASFLPTVPTSLGLSGPGPREERARRAEREAGEGQRSSADRLGRAEHAGRLLDTSLLWTHDRLGLCGRALSWRTRIHPWRVAAWVLHRVAWLAGIRGRRLSPASLPPLPLESVHIHLVSARARRGLVWLAVARPVENRARRRTVLDRDLPGGFAVAVQLRLVGRGRRVRVMRRVVRRLHARLCGAGVILGGSRGRRCRSLVFLHLPRGTPRVAVILRTRSARRGRHRVVLPVAVALPVTGVRRSGSQGSDAKHEHESARKPQFHFSPS